MKKLFMIAAMMILLASSGSGQKKESLPFPVPLNHFFLVVDSATYADIEKSGFLRKEFAVSEQRTTVRTDMTYTGVYFYGTNTYFEFFDAAKGARRLGDSAIAFGVDEQGALQILQSKFASQFPMQLTPITRQFGDKQVPWFLMASPRAFPFGSGLSTWIMEYDPRFLAEWNPSPNGDNQGMSRKHILRRYAAVLKDAPANPILRDVAGLTLALDKNAMAKLIEICRFFGYDSRADGDATVLEGPDMALRLIAETPSARGIRQVTLRVHRAPEKQTVFRFGPSSVLTFHGDGKATWSF